jgi:hypothetical protein
MFAKLIQSIYNFPIFLLVWIVPFSIYFYRLVTTKMKDHKIKGIEKMMDGYR